MDPTRGHNHTRIAAITPNTISMSPLTPTVPPSIQEQMMQARSLTPTGAPNALPTPQQKHLFLNQQYQNAMKQLQKRFSGRLTPHQMQAAHLGLSGGSNITPGSAMSTASSPRLNPQFGMIVRPPVTPR